MKISEAVDKYVDWLFPQGEPDNDEEMREGIRGSLTIAMKMLLALPYEVKGNNFAKACAVLSAYMISNGASLENDIEHRRMIFNQMVKTICDMTAEAGNPLGMCLDFFYGEEPKQQ